MPLVVLPTSRTWKGEGGLSVESENRKMKIHFDPPLSSHRYGLLQRSPMGLVLKCIIFFNHLFWAEKGEY
uniref:Uncharacterized protein n=1 Tax=Timema douglasi TaxID=61478 RepID=A0A7R8Z9D8_TIMDO|nr:unnamed protein product [Timema douglasi]